MNNEIELNPNPNQNEKRNNLIPPPPRRTNSNSSGNNITTTSFGLSEVENNNSNKNSNFSIELTDNNNNNLNNENEMSNNELSQNHNHDDENVTLKNENLKKKSNNSILPLKIDVKMKPTEKKIMWIISGVILLFISAFITLPILYWVWIHKDYNATPIDDLQPTVLLISIDGFRWDYFSKIPINNYYNMSTIMKRGVKANSLIPQFPSLTFPNHYTIVTGLYPESHGIVANDMYDPVLNLTFSLSNGQAKNGVWWWGEPLWVTAELQGQKSATYFWPGSDAEIMGVRPTYYKLFDDSIPNSERVSTVLEWLDKPVEERPTFLTLYFSDVDHAGHTYGPNSEQVVQAIQQVDVAIGQLLEGLKQRDIMGKMNIIIVSDHGMTQLSPEKYILIDEALDCNSNNLYTDQTAKIITYYPITSVMPTDMYTNPNQQFVQDEISLISNTITNCSQQQNLVQQYMAVNSDQSPYITYLKNELPSNFYYDSNRRIPPIVALADLGWTVTTKSYLASRPNSLSGGAHGYNPSYLDMQGIFIAAGPAFISNSTVTEVPSFQNIHIYELISHILNLEPAPNNGSLSEVSNLLK